MNETSRCEERARGSPAAIARELAPAALRRIGALLDDGDTDARLLVQAAKLVLWATQLSDGGEEEERGGFELCFTGGADGDA